MRSVVCRDWVELVTAYLDDALPGRLRKAVDRHLAGCEACRAYLSQVRATVALLGHFPSTPPPSELVDALERAYAER